MQDMQRTLRAVVDRIVEAVRPKRIVLFGSAARGLARPDSDLDLLVVVADGTHRRQTAQHLHEKLLGFEVPIDIVVATESDLEELSDNFSLVFYPAVRDGIELYAA